MKKLILLSACLACLLAPSAAPAETEEAKSRFVPWSGYWWPHQDGGIVEPLRKYDQLTGRKAASWEQKNYPPGPANPEWAGYCHAWSASAVMEKEPRRTVTPSDQGEQVELAVGDQKALLAACHTKDANDFHGDRNNGQENAGNLPADELWRVLKLYVKQQGVPLIIDIDPSPAVWNYPVYAYRVDYTPSEGGGDEIQGQMSLWLADDAVPPDFVGTKVRVQTYHFTCRMRNGSIVMGSSKWIGPSASDHPDFAWYPLAAVSENPEVNHDAVLKLVAKGATDDSGSGGNTGGNSGGGDYDPSDPTGDSNPPSGNHKPERAMAISASQLLALVANRTSSFDFDVTVDRFDGGQYREGETLSIRGASDKAGYLYLFELAPPDPNKPEELSLSLLFPRPGQDNRIPAKVKFEIPRSKDKFKFVVTGPQGTHVIKAIVTTRPLALAGLDQTRLKTKVKGKSRQSQTFLLPPAQKQQVQEVTTKMRQGKMKPEQVEEWAKVKPHKLIGEFAQDEIPYYVDAAGKPRQKEE